MAIAYDYTTNELVHGRPTFELVEASAAAPSGAVLCREDFDGYLVLVAESDRRDGDRVVWIDADAGTY